MSGASRFLGLALVGILAAAAPQVAVAGCTQAAEATVLALSTASRHPAIALAVTKIIFPTEPHLGATILLYLLVLTVLTVPYVLRLRRLSVAHQH